MSFARTLAVVLTGLTLTLPGAARAAEPTDAQKEAIRSACPADFRAHCAGVAPGGLPALQCLETNMSKLSAACQEAVKAVTGG